ncbi:uncharacterized protein LOC143197342 isoform X4 [Rhynchophorus ferrugineus]|uniref:uncharacterized protein LOC143197342 isoform X4 n=1 Tax=Rhynchophorus ferrugineus TaxID=354439 RepID=UPI003FCCE295
MSESLNGQNVELEDRRQRTRTDSATQTPPAIVLSALADNVWPSAMFVSVSLLFAWVSPISRTYIKYWVNVYIKLNQS